MKLDSYDQSWSVYFVLESGTYSYIFFDEISWFINEGEAVEVDEDGNKNNIISI